MAEGREIRRTTKAMASVVTAQVLASSGGPAPHTEIESAIDRAFAEFHLLERHCTRFDESSSLARANRDPGGWHRVPEVLFALIEESVSAHRRTGGLFDPRIHDRLVELGYDRSFHLLASVHENDPGACAPAPAPADRFPRNAWRPWAIPGLRLVNLRGERIDLGGIGKGMALRRATERMRPVARNFLLDAGGDLYASGVPGEAHAWRVGVEPPSGSGDPVAVLEVSDKAVATSSVRVRTWKNAGRRVHHLIDPRTGDPGGEGLTAVTVVGSDPVWAETWAKSLFICGSATIAKRADDLEVAALWVFADGTARWSPAMEPFVIWTGA